MVNSGILAAAALCLLLPLLSRLIKWHRDAQFARANGCKAAPCDNLLTWTDLLGIGILRKLEHHLSQKTLLEFMRKRFEENGNTFRTRVLLDDFYWTCEVIAPRKLFTANHTDCWRQPKNIQAMLALKFNDFGVGIDREHIGSQNPQEPPLITDGNPRLQQLQAPNGTWNIYKRWCQVGRSPRFGPPQLCPEPSRRPRGVRATLSEHAHSRATRR